MRRKLLSILALMLIGVGSAWADGDGSAENPWICGDCKVTLIGGDLTVSKTSGTGAMADYTSAFYLPWKDSRNSITSIVVEEGVTHIGNYAFAQCRYATSIPLPTSLTSIGNYAFQGCNNASLTSITIPANVTSIGANAFQACSKLTSITIPANVTSIGANAFQSCSSLTSVTIPNSVTSIGTQAFYGCSGLMTVSIGSGLTSLEKNVFGGCSGLTKLTIGSSVTTIGESAFYGCSGLTSVTIPNNVETIGDNAFNGCSGLQSLTIGSSVTSIGLRAFYNCANLTSVTIPNNVETIGDMAFQRCTNLATANIGSGVTSIGTNVFSGCSNLTAFNVADGNTAFSSDGGVLFNVDKTTIVQYPVGKSGDSYDIPASVTSIGVYAFSGCANLTAVNIPSGVTSIGDYAFGATGLTSVEIPASVTSIGRCAFQNCLNLATVTVYAPSCSLGEDAFANCNELANIYVFSDLVDGYKDAENWSSYEDKITEMPNPNGKCGDNVRWALTGESTNYTLTITGSGAMANYASSSVQPWNDYRSSIKTVVIGNGVTSIGERAFYNTGLTSIDIPASVTSIGNYTFAKCTGLTSIEIPASVTSIGDDAFWNCSNLATVTFAEDSQLATIGISAFNSCRGLASVEIPASVTSIGERAFSGSSLGSVTFADGSRLESIGNYAFDNTGLTSIEIPASVTNIRGYAFENCPNLATVTVYALECRLGEDAFNNCTKLENIYVFSDLVDDYKTATNWKKYMGKITALPTVTTSYVDATGTLHEGVQAIPLNNVMTTLPAGTYVVNSDVAYTGTITLYGDVNIILADGKTMTASGGNYGIYGYGGGPLTIYGQALGTGILTVTSTNDVGIRVVDGVTINGGTVNATGIFSDGDVTINGGKVTSTIDPGICSNNGTITLGLRNATDYITAESYSASLGIIVKAGQTLTDGISTYSGTLTDEQKIAIAEKVLTPPTYSVTANRATKEDTEYWSTFYHPAAGYTADENTTVYQAAVNTTTNKVELTAVPGREIPADKAVVLKSTQSAITLSRATTTQTLDGNELKGGSTVADGKVPYTLAAKDGMVGFYKFVGAALNPNKAHLEITAPAQSAPAFFGFEENTTAINEHELHESHELSGAWYSLDGRKLSGKPSVKGIYVRNGRKFIIK